MNSLAFSLVRVASIATLIFTLANAPVNAGEMIPELRVATALGNQSDVHMISAAWYGDVPGWTRASRLEYSVGAINDADQSSGFVFVGPVWELIGGGRPTYLEFSLGPTLLSGSTIDGRELGGNFHFRSALALGRTFGARRNMHLALRVSHISNGGLRELNPGLDFIGLSFTVGAR